MNEVTVRPGDSLAIRYDGPLTAEQAGSITRRLTGALPGVEVIVVIVGQDSPDAATAKILEILTGGGVNPQLAQDLIAALGAADDPAAFAEHFEKLRRTLTGGMPD